MVQVYRIPSAMLSKLPIGASCVPPPRSLPLFRIVKPIGRVETMPLIKRLRRSIGLRWLKMQSTQQLIEKVGAAPGSAFAEAAIEALKERLAHQDGSLDGLDWSGARLEGALLSSCTLRGARFSGAALAGAYFAYSALEAADFSGADLREAHFRGADLSGAIFDGAQLPGAHFSRADLSGASFIAADLTGANLWGADLRGADFSRAVLSECNFQQAKLDSSAAAAIDYQQESWLA